MPLERRAAASFREVYAEPTRDSTSIGSPLLPEIQMLGHARFAAAQRLGLPQHRHADAFELCYVVDGSLYWHLGEKAYSLHRGDIFVTPPDAPHGGEDAVMQPCEIFWVQVAIAAAQALPGLSAEQTEAIHSALTATAASPAFSASEPAQVASAFDALLREHRGGTVSKSALSAAAARAALQTLLIRIVRDAVDAATVRNHLSPPLSRALHWMEAHLGETFTIDAAAAAVDLSAAAFHDRFQREVGTSPAEWRTQKRIERAKLWLIQNPEKSVTEIALMLGFSSSQYFATAFKRYTAHTPTEYRQEHRNPRSISQSAVQW